MERTSEVSVEDDVRKICVCGSDSETEYFMVTAREIGNVNLTATVSRLDWFID